MLRTPLCDVLGIDVPIILAPMGSATSAEFAAAVSNQGGLGGIGSLFRTTAAIKRDNDVVRTLTKRPHAVNHIPQLLDADAFRHTLAARPAVISFALGDPGDLVRQAHDAGARVMLQITTVAQAVEAAERGVDVIIAQGGEAGGFCGTVSTMVLVPQVVDAVAPIPVVAAGGIFSNDISPLPGEAGYKTVLRSLHTDFLDEWSAKREEARRQRDRLLAQVVSTHQAGRQHETLLTAGQSAGGIKDVVPVAEIMRRLIAEAEAALAKTAGRVANDRDRDVPD